MKIATGWSTLSSSREATAEAFSMVSGQLQGELSLLLVHASCEYDTSAVVGHLGSLAPGVPLHGGTSCLGVMTQAGFHTRAGRGMGILGIADPEGSYGVGIAELAGDHVSSTRTALDQALDRSGRPGELPVAVLMCSSPGEEGGIIAAIEDHLGCSVPIIGGTSADNDMSGAWMQFGNDVVLSQSVSVATLFPSSAVGYAFHSGYEPTDHLGRATRAAGRLIQEIDNRPAAQVYNEWTGGLIQGVLNGGSLVPTATFSPLGIPVGQVGGITYYQLSYPVQVLPDGALELFSDVHQGCEVVLMEGTHETLVTRAGRVISAAEKAATFSNEEIEGALVLFCTGCMLAIQDRMQFSADGIRAALNGAPFLTTFTLGEQGCFIGGENRHANLMIAALIFGPTRG